MTTWLRPSEKGTSFDHGPHNRYSSTNTNKCWALIEDQVDQVIKDTCDLDSHARSSGEDSNGNSPMDNDDKKKMGMKRKKIVLGL